MQMCNNYISNILRLVSALCKPTRESRSPMQISVTEEFLILLIAPPGIHEYDPAPGFDNQGCKAEVNCIVCVRLRLAAPESFRNHSEHRSPVYPEV